MLQLRSDVASAPVGARVVVPASPTGTGDGEKFSDVLAERLGVGGITFSAHAQKRLSQADSRFDAATADRLRSAVDRAERKGAHDSLVLLDDLAFVVSVKNRTVITAIEGGRARENVFTNIDSVVIG